MVIVRRVGVGGGACWQVIMGSILHQGRDEHQGKDEHQGRVEHQDRDEHQGRDEQLTWASRLSWHKLSTKYVPGKRIRTYY